MKLTLVSHSLIHARQYLFANELRRQGVEVQEIFPVKWGQLTRQGGFDVHSEGNIYAYVFEHEAIKAIEKFKPDYLYVMMEPDSLVAYQMSSLARRLRCKFVCFTWENIKKTYFPFQEEVTRSCDLLICGNKEAKEIMLNKGLDEARLKVLPQCGVETSVFKPLDVDKEWNCIYVGRMAGEKGIRLIKEAYPETVFVTGVDYGELPTIYSKTRLFVTFPYSTPSWKEQSGSYTTLEAMACELPVISSKCGAVEEYLEGSEAYLVREKDVKGLRKAIELLLSISDAERAEIGRKNRDFVVRRYSNTVIAQKLLEALKALD